MKHSLALRLTGLVTLVLLLPAFVVGCRRDTTVPDDTGAPRRTDEPTPRVSAADLPHVPAIARAGVAS